jgi:hypothetical protein
MGYDQADRYEDASFDNGLLKIDRLRPVWRGR